MSKINALIRVVLRGPIGLRELSLAIAALSAATLISMLILEHVFGLRPCHLCLEERVPHYAAIPLALATFFLARPVPMAARALMGVIAVAFVYNTGLSAYHSGVEWGWWPGPDACTGVGTVASNTKDLLASLNAGGGVVVRCDEAPLRVLGLSLAAYGALLSAFMAFLAAAGALGLDLAAWLRGIVLSGHGRMRQQTR